MREGEEAEQKETKRVQQAREEMANSRQCLQNSKDTLTREEEILKADLKAADELMSDATSKLHDALSATGINKLFM